VDIELARTFLAIVETGTFVRAASRLNVTQTTVSARIRSLETQLGRSLFVRNKAGASLTSAGEQFLRYAPTFVQLWERARHQVAVPEGRRASRGRRRAQPLEPVSPEMAALDEAGGARHRIAHTGRGAWGIAGAGGRWRLGHRHHVRAAEPSGLGHREALRRAARSGDDRQGTPPNERELRVCRLGARVRHAAT
jgi:hypothetical protein